MKGFRQWRWHLDERFVKVIGERHFVDNQGVILKPFVAKKRDKAAAFAFMKKALKQHGKLEKIVADAVRTYRPALREPA